jgi:hypothetical protein
VFPSGGLALIGTSNKLSRVFSDPAFLLPETGERCPAAEISAANPHFDQPDTETNRQAADVKRLAARFSRPSYTRDSCIGIAQALAMLAHL